MSAGGAVSWGNGTNPRGLLADGQPLVLPDAHILETHYQNRQGGWAGILGQYRGDVTHHGYLPILEENRDVEELIVVRDYLHDALTRVILEVDGGYKPGFVPEYGVSHPVDWVKHRFPARALGY